MIRGVCNRFGSVGAFVGRHPYVSLALCFALAAPPLIALAFRICFGPPFDPSLDEGFVTPNAPSRREIAAQKAFFNANGEPWYLALFAIARKHGNLTGNMLNSAEFEEFNSFYMKVTEQLELQVEGEDGEDIRYKYVDICKPLCEINDQLQKLMDNSWLASLRYPVSRVLVYDVNIGKHVFNRTVNPSTGDLQGAEFVAFYFTVFVETEIRKKQLELFENSVAKLAAKHNQNPNALVDLFTHGSTGVTLEMGRGVSESGLYIMIGHCAAALTFLLLHLTSGCFNSQFPCKRFALALLSLISTLLSLPIAIGALVLGGNHPNLLLFFTSPMLAICLVTNTLGTFQIVGTWNRLLSESRRKQFTATERLVATFEKIAPSYATSNLISIVGLLFAHFLVDPENYKVFALGMAFALMYTTFCQIFGFSALLSLFCHHKLGYLGSDDPEYLFEVQHKPSIVDRPPIIRLIETNEKQSKWEKAGSVKIGNGKLQKPVTQLDTSLGRKIFDPLANYLSSLSGRLTTICIFALIGWLAIAQGVFQLRNTMDYRRLLQEKSPAIRGFQMMDTIWNDFLQILYIVENPPNFEDQEEFTEFKKFIADASGLPQALSGRSHMSWLFDYYQDSLSSDFFAQLSDNQSIVDMSKFDAFINGFPYKAWQSGVKFTYEGENRSHVNIEKMLVMIAYNETMELTGKQRLINQCREVAKKYPQFSIIVFDTDSRTADIMDAVPPTLYKFAMAFLIATGLVSLVMFGNLSTTSLSLVTSTSVFLTLFGFGHLFGLELDLLTVPAAAIIAMLSLQFGVQFIGEFVGCWAKENRIGRALEQMAPQFAMGLIIWILIALPQMLTSVEFFATLFRLLTLGAILAMAHAFLLLPALYALLRRTK